MITSLTHPCNFEGITHEEMPQAERIAEFLAGYDKKQVVLDVGCGPGIYVTKLREAGITAYGVDIDPRCEPVPHCYVVDITDRKLPRLFEPNTVISFEVGEHIPEEKSWDYIRYISIQNPSMVIFSAAAPGQGGDGHINCQNKSYWSHRFQRFGFNYDGKATEIFVDFLISGPHMGWLRNNAMVFYRQ